jgi:hypothetical protein
VNVILTRRAGRRAEEGYALLIVVFLCALLLISALAAAPSILIEGKRQKEEEMIWRGKQYVRGVKLHFRKLGRFPSSLEDLTKPKVGTLRFMRQAYKDPMNKEDGEWRVIYVGVAGQLIGSLKPPKTLQLSAAGGLGTPAATLAAGGTPQPGSQPTSTSSGMNPPGTGIAASNPSSDFGSNPQPIAPTDTPTIMGGRLIGVGSKIDQASVKIYETATNYHLFEFIWDPSKDTLVLGQPGMQTGTGLGNPIGQPTTSPGVPIPAGNPPQNP